MSRTALQMASLRIMLDTLRNDSSAVISFNEIAYYLNSAEIKHLKQMRDYYKDVNDHADVRAIELSCDAEAYWRKAQHAMRATRLANNVGGDNAQLKKAGWLCEQAAEFYSEVVVGTPSAKAFKEFQAGPHHWDDRWRDTEDHHIPLLIKHFSKVSSPLRYAQISVLEDILEPRVVPVFTAKPVTPEQTRSLRDLARRLSQ